AAGTIGATRDTGGSDAMDTPLHLTFRDFPPSDALAEAARRRADKLDGIFDHIVACKVAIEAPHRRHQHGKRYRVRVEIVVPGSELVVARNPADDITHEDAYVAREAAFDDAERMLQEHARQVRGEVKRRNGSPHARVA